MTRRDKQIETIDDAIAAYGGAARMEREFRRVRNSKAPVVSSWREDGEIPRGHHLGLYLGLLQLGYAPAPRLFGVRQWADLPGWPTGSKLPKSRTRKR